jgi:hypothetical protein
MVDAKTQNKPVNPRDAIRERRQRRLRVITEGKDATVKVYAANETMRDALRHPVGNKRFRDKLDQAVEWPNDSFTARRIADGSVRTDGPGSGEMAEPDETLNAREQAEANKPKKNGKPQASQPPHQPPHQPQPAQPQPAQPQSPPPQSPQQSPARPPAA